MQKNRRHLMTILVIFLIRIYRNTLSHWMLHSCRFTPTCSLYAQEAFSRYGILRGFFKTTRRAIKCQPFGPFGYDPLT
ncbi:MAG: membrane protein insertion efficiency factor YidD [Candidatus Omnitrophica bacterium]|nr:membrane protein insertion efficiency factor YidD [Candidatus Omnitrophota bacterium]